MNKQKLSIILAVIGVLGAIGGGSYALDFSNTQTTNTDNSQTTTTVINEGDTIINEVIDTYTGDLFEDFVDYAYDEYCEEIDPDSPQCDEYWGD